MKRLLTLTLFLGLSCGPQIGSRVDDFTGNTIHEANVSTSAGLIGSSLILKANRIVSPTNEETFILRVIWTGSSWLFIKNMTLKNPTNSWTKELSWNNYDVDRDVITGTLVKEETPLVLSKADFMDILSQSQLNIRVYGKDSYTTFSYSSEKLVAWKQFLSTKMEL
jgi:hypothetical protein